MGKLKSFRACFYKRENGCAPVFATIVCYTMKAAKQEAAALAEQENARLVSLTAE